jgi:UDP-glucose 4-epimerase
MRVAVTGATGNIGTSVVSALAATPEITEIVGIARRLPDWRPRKTRFVAADVGRSDLGEAFAGVDAVVHLAWLIQPSRDRAELHRANVGGSQRVFAAAVAAGARTIVHSSSIGAYSSGPSGDRRVDESWPTDGVDSSFYSRHKSYVERVLDHVERSNPDLRVVRIRPSLVGKRESATGLRRLFIGPLLPNLVVGRLPIGPAVTGLRVQFSHSDDIAECFRLAVVNDRARGAYNLAAEPVLSSEMLASALGRRPVPVPAALVRGAAAVTWRLRLQPTPPGWIDLVLALPLMDASRARRELGWEPRHDAVSALREVLDGLHDGAEGLTPPLRKAASGRARIREFTTGVGARG